MFPYRMVPLGHSKKECSLFDCGEEPLNIYLKRYAKKNHKTGVSTTHVMESSSDGSIMGYYSLSLAGLDRGTLNDAEERAAPRYVERLPVYHLTRLALDSKQQGKKLGSALLIEALKSCYQAAEIVGAIAVIVDAKHVKAKAFYEYYGFAPMPEQDLKLFMTIHQLRAFVEPLLDS